MATIERFCAPGVFDPGTYTQGIKVSQAQTILFLASPDNRVTRGGIVPVYGKA